MELSTLLRGEWEVQRYWIWLQNTTRTFAADMEASNLVALIIPKMHLQ